MKFAGELASLVVRQSSNSYNNHLLTEDFDKLIGEKISVSHFLSFDSSFDLSFDLAFVLPTFQRPNRGLEIAGTKKPNEQNFVL